MALRSVATRMRTAAGSALRQPPGAAMAAAPARFLGTVPSQVGDARPRPRNGVRDFALSTLRDARKQEEAMRRGIKVDSRIAKVMWWTYKLGVTAAVGVLLVNVASKEA